MVTKMFPCVLRCNVLIALMDKYLRGFRTNVLCIARVFSTDSSKSMVLTPVLPLTVLLSPFIPPEFGGGSGWWCWCLCVGVACALDKGEAIVEITIM